jgi:cell division cycle protein 20 (cofactor of APC complex)
VSFTSIILTFQEVCGLKWSLDGNYLASGANDNQLRIWSSPNNSNQPIHILVEHSAAVRAIAWCPWQSSMVASGGGTADRTIRLWNVNTGTCTMTTDTDSQVFE